MSFRFLLAKRQVQEYWMFFTLPIGFIFPFSQQCNMDQSLSPMEQSIMYIINLLDNYSIRKDIMYEYLNKEDIRKLLKKEAPNFLLVSFLLKRGKYGLQ